MKKTIGLTAFLLVSFFAAAQSWIRINQLGYPTKGIKVAVWGSKKNSTVTGFDLIDAVSGKTVFHGPAGKAFGAYGPFMQTYRLAFTAFNKPGRYYLKAGDAKSPEFRIDDNVYKGTADFCLRYMRQQRSGFNPFLNDSCHTHDGYTMYGPMPDSTHIDVVGGWHDASDYLQYTTTTANATWHLLEAFHDFGAIFGDAHQANGLKGKNGKADILDEAKWGLDWLLKMNPRDEWMFNQLGDDRDHMGMRIPKEDTYYGKGFERPVYFINGKPQQRGKFMNATTGAASTAGKFASTFALASVIYSQTDSSFSARLLQKAKAAFAFGEKMPGVAQTVSVKSPYIYAEGNWTDDMELAAAELSNALWQQSDRSSDNMTRSGFAYARQEPVTPWLGSDTANHYQWYPFVNAGHMKMAWVSQRNGAFEKMGDSLLAYYKQGIMQVWNKAKQNAFYRGIPFIWCSNNLTVSFALQCYWYAQMSGDTQFAEFMQSNIDWIFGCNPWGTSMVYGLPASGDTPVDPHSAFTHLKNYPIDGGLVDGPVYTSIYKGLIGIQLKEADEYAAFQSDLAVYHDDYGDYSTNEPTMDGTASLIYLLASQENQYNPVKGNWIAYPPTDEARAAYRIRDLNWQEGIMIRGDSTRKEIALVFTGDEFGDGLSAIASTLEKEKIKASFFFTGRFYRNKSFQSGIRKLITQQHLLGVHSDQHVLYNDWTQRNKTLVTKDSLLKDLRVAERSAKAAGVSSVTKYFIPPYEWWNTEVAGWLDSAGYKTFSFTPGTTSNADYTWPDMGKSYRSSDEILGAIKKYDQQRPGHLNGVVLLIHTGTDPRRTDKLYNRLPELIAYLRQQGYVFKKADELLRYY